MSENIYFDERRAAQKRLSDRDHYRYCTEPDAVAASALDLCDAIREAIDHGYALQPEICNRTWLSELVELAWSETRDQPAGRSRDLSVARTAHLFCDGLREAIDNGLESYRGLYDLGVVDLLQVLATRIRQDLRAQEQGRQASRKA
jgi:hypothetical protein